MSSRSVIGVAVVSAVSIAPVVLTVAPAHALVLLNRYTTPTASTTGSCSQASPCDLTTAIDEAPARASVFIAPGTYGSSAAPLATTLSNETQSGTQSLTVVGENPAHPPVIITSAGEGLFITGGAVSNLIIVSSSINDGIDLFDTTADHVSVYASDATYGACSIYNSSLTDSLCAQAGAGKPAMDIDASHVDEEDDIVRGVTAVSTGRDGVGLKVNATSTTVAMTATNSIFSGTDSDLSLAATGLPVTITLKHSAYRPLASGTTGTASIVAGGTDVTARPRFLSPMTGIFVEKASSPTVDAGAKDASADSDLAGNPRTLGTAPDLGAFELLEKPTFGHITHLHTHQRSASFRVTIDGEGLTTIARAVVKHAHKRITTKAVTVTTMKTVKLHVRHLKRNTTYKVRVMATNLGGHRHSRSRQIATT